MAGAYPFALSVHLPGDGTPKKKPKLVKYFQSKKSGGGDCLVEYDPTRTVLRFRTEEARQRVLEKPSHEIIVGESTLKMTVHLLHDEIAPEQETPADDAQNTSPDKTTPGDARAPDAENLTAEEEACSTSAVLSNIPQDTDEEFLMMLVEAISKSPDFSLDLLPDICSAVVTFHSGQENTAFITSCPSNRIFKNKGISVRALDVTTKVIMEDIPNNVNEDVLLLYFDGMDVEHVLFNDEEQSAFITFKSPKAAQRVVEKEHVIMKKPFKVFPFYDSLGTALYGKDKPTPKLPAAFSESVDPAICAYLLDKREDAKKLCEEMESHFCKVDFKQSAVRLSPLPSLLQRKGFKAKDVSEWPHVVKVALERALSTFRSLELQVESTAWEESEAEVRRAVLNKAAIVVADKDKGLLSVSGVKDDVDRLEKPLQEVLLGIDQKVKREKSCKTQEISLSPSVYHLLFQDGLQDKILREYPELKIEYNEESQKFITYGLSNEAWSANRKVVDGVQALKRQRLQVDDFVLDFLKGDDQEKLTSSLLTSNKLDAALEISGKMVQLIAVSDSALSKAEQELKKLLISRNVDVEDRDVLKMPEWKELVADLEKTTNSSFRKVLIQTLAPAPGQQVVVSGFKDGVEIICNKLDDFLHKSTGVEEVVTVKLDTIVRYIEEHKRNAWSSKVSGVVVTFNKDAICLRGPRANVRDCKDLFDGLVSSVVSDTLKVPKPGAKKFFKDAEAMYVSSILSNTGCLVQLVDELDCRQDSFPGRQHNPTYQVQTPDGVEIAVCQADMCSYPVNAIVISSDEKLSHSGGLAAALLDAAGPQVRDQLDGIIKQRGQIKPGDCVVTGAGGQLSCKHIIHAVGPQFDSFDSKRSEGQLRRAVKRSLELAEEHGCLSVALPAISRNRGFPLILCVNTIVKAVEDYCDIMYGNNTLKSIHLVDRDDGTVQAMESAVRKMFGDDGVGSSRQDDATGPAPSHHGGMVQTGSDQWRTKEGLCITLSKGNIQDAMTEVVVNTVGEDLELKGGAVSRAILGAAGPKLQDLVRRKQSRGKVGDVIVTAGCQLKSKKVFHTIAPYWDQGQGVAEKILRGMVEDCLKQAEGNAMASVTFPAIGTGNLGFPRDLVASLMLDVVLQFSRKKQPKTLKKVVFIFHPRDAETIQAFTDEFTRSHTGAPKPTTTSATATPPTATPPTATPPTATPPTATPPTATPPTATPPTATPPTATPPTATPPTATPPTATPPTATQSKGPFSKVTSSSGMHETTMRGVTIQVVVGDITTETSDVIVNSSDDTFTLKSGVSKAILDAAGPSVEVECQQLAAQQDQDMIMTQPGNLKCKKILHLIGQTDPVQVRTVVTDALQMCVTNSYTSVSFPAIGTGQGGVQASQVAEAMLDAVVDVVGQSAQSPLKTIRIIIFQPGMLTDFHSIMQSKATVASKPSASSPIKAHFALKPASKPQKDQDFTMQSQEVDPACFNICGDSQGKVDAAKKWIKDRISSNQTSRQYKDSAILCLSASDRQRIVDMQSTMGVRVEYDGSRTSLTIEGVPAHLAAATAEIDVMLTRARKVEAVKRAEAEADWQYGTPGLQFQSVDPTSNFHLEQALWNKQRSVTVTIQGVSYDVDLPSGIAVGPQGNSLKVRRVDKLIVQDPLAGLPPHWQPMTTSEAMESFPLTPGDPEHNEVLKLFRVSCPTSLCTVFEIARIQNPGMWRSLEIKKKDMEIRNGHQNNEKRLFHGACYSTIDSINYNGFNRNYAGKNATLYGKGTYFAVNAEYSSYPTYSKPEPRTKKQYMYLCRVLTGDYTLGTPKLETAPAKNSISSPFYDSVVNVVAKPIMFIVFHDQMAYPEYLITFRRLQP